MRWAKILPNTHIEIARRTYKKLNLQEIGIIESKFVRGSVIPDIYPKYKIKKHYYNESKDFIILKANIIQNVIKLTPQLAPLFSLDLGIICHFISDYCCKPHNEYETCRHFKSAKEHIKYEIDLNNYVKENKNLLTRHVIIDNVEEKKIAEILENIQEQYNSEDTKDFNRDITFANASCGIVMNKIKEQAIESGKNRIILPNLIPEI